MGGLVDFVLCQLLPVEEQVISLKVGVFMLVRGGRLPLEGRDLSRLEVEVSASSPRLPAEALCQLVV